MEHTLENNDIDILAKYNNMKRANELCVESILICTKCIDFINHNCVRSHSTNVSPICFIIQKDFTKAMQILYLLELNVDNKNVQHDKMAQISLQAIKLMYPQRIQHCDTYKKLLHYLYIHNAYYFIDTGEPTKALTILYHMKPITFSAHDMQVLDDLIEIAISRNNAIYHKDNVNLSDIHFI